MHHFWKSLFCIKRIYQISENIHTYDSVFRRQSKVRFMKYTIYGKLKRLRVNVKKALQTEKKEIDTVQCTYTFENSLQTPQRQVHNTCTHEFNKLEHFLNGSY